MFAFLRFIVLLAAVPALASHLKPTSTLSPAPTASPVPEGRFLEVTAIVTNSHNDSALECWRLTDAFTKSGEAGTAGASAMDIKNFANATYTILPPRFEGGVHNAPHPQIVVFLSGVAHVTLPHGSGDAFVVGGADGMIFAVDTIGTGHNTSYPSNTETRALQIPFTDGTIPPHVVLSSGACTADSQIVTLP